MGFDLECVSQFGLDVGRLKWCFVGGVDFWMVFELVRDDLCTGLGKGVLKVNASYASCVCSKTLNSMWIPLVCGGGAHTVRDSLHTPETQDTFSFGKKEW